MVCAGVPTANVRHAEQIANMALAMLEKMPEINRDLGLNLQLRIGIHSGDIVAGVIGKAKFAYDMWGDTVNTASRMESTSLPGHIQVSPATYEHLYDKGYRFEARGEIDVKGKGTMKTFFLQNRLQPGISWKPLAAAMHRPEHFHHGRACHHGSECRVSAFKAPFAAAATIRRHRPRLRGSAA